MKLPILFLSIFLSSNINSSEEIKPRYSHEDSTDIKIKLYYTPETTKINLNNDEINNIIIKYTKGCFSFFNPDTFYGTQVGHDIIYIERKNILKYFPNHIV